MKNKIAAAFMSGGEKGKVVEGKTKASKADKPMDDLINVRDMVSAFVGKKYTGLQDDDSRSMYTRLSQTLGQDKAQKLLNHVFVYNQSVGDKEGEERVNDFFNTPAADNEVSGLLKNARGLSYGVADGFRNSPLYVNSEIQGKEITKGKKSGDYTELLKLAALKKIR